MNYTNIDRVILNLKNSNPNTTRYDCPYCYGIKTLSIGNTDKGLLFFNCFRAGCSTHGIIKQELSLNDVSQTTRPNLDHTSRTNHFIVPDYFCSPLNNDAAYKYLRDNHCIYAYSKDLVDIKYDPRQNRVVFICKHTDGSIQNAVGRSLERNPDRKWLIYSDNSYPLFVGKTISTAVLVEDAASACAVSEAYTGVAILGTSFKFDYWHLLHKYDRVVIALDQDALRKGIKLEHAMSFFCKNVSVQYLTRDLKYLNIKEIKEIIDG